MGIRTLGKVREGAVRKAELEGLACRHRKRGHTDGLKGPRPIPARRINDNDSDKTAP